MASEDVVCMYTMEYISVVKESYNLYCGWALKALYRMDKSDKDRYMILGTYQNPETIQHQE